jgi:hypothetical protein
MLDYVDPPSHQCIIIHWKPIVDELELSHQGQFHLITNLSSKLSYFFFSLLILLGNY